jgi:60 kDa SS-A/Ro ribonucleoprotein
MSNYLTSFNVRRTPQSESISGRTDQVTNDAGGVVFAADDFTRLRRFLILGAEGGTYYVDERKATRANGEVVLRCLREDGLRVVREIVDVSESGRAARNDPALFALAMAAADRDVEVRRAALAALPRVARIGTHLYHFMTFVAGFRGRGRALHRALGRWFTDKTPDQLAYQAVKYRQRDGWAMRDVLKLARPAPPTPDHDAIFRFLTDPTQRPDHWRRAIDHDVPVPAPIEAYGAATNAATSRDVVRLVERYGGQLPREAIPAGLIDADVWRALLKAGMPMTALIRNLAAMTRVGVLTPTSAEVGLVHAQLRNVEAIRKSRIHPVQALVAMKTYASGRSLRGDAAWAPVPSIVDALDRLFYDAFGNLESTGKRWLIGLDVSGSMDARILGIPNLSAREAAAAMALVIAASGDPYETVAFTSSRDAWSGRRTSPPPGQWRPTDTHYRGRFSDADGVSPFALSARQRLDDVAHATAALPMGGTDCALPMRYAKAMKLEVDVFVVITDNETWAGDVHPTQALADYRRTSGIDAKLAVVATTSSGFTIADPTDPRQIDMVGFDANLPVALGEFAKL